MCVYVNVENTAMASSIKKWFVRPCVCVHVGKVYWNNVSIVGRNKEDKNLTLLTDMSMRVCIYVRDRKYGPFAFLSPHMRFFIIFGDNVSRSGSLQKNIAYFFALCPVCPCLSQCSSGMP